MKKNNKKFRKEKRYIRCQKKGYGSCHSWFSCLLYTAEEVESHILKEGQYWRSITITIPV